MLRYCWLPINHYLLHLVGFSFTYFCRCLSVSYFSFLFLPFFSSFYFPYILVFGLGSNTFFLPIRKTDDGSNYTSIQQAGNIHTSAWQFSRKFCAAFSLHWKASTQRHNGYSFNPQKLSYNIPKVLSFLILDTPTAPHPPCHILLPAALSLKSMCSLFSY